MRISATVVAVLSLSLLLTLVLADTGGRVVAVEGSLSVLVPGAPATSSAEIGQQVPVGSTLVAAEGCRARIEISGLGVLTMTGPAECRLTSVEGVTSLVAVAGTSSFEYREGKVMLGAEKTGSLELSGVAGYSGTLVAMTSFLVSGNSESARVEARSGTAMLSGESDHIRLLAGDAVFLPLVRAEGEAQDQISLRSREIEVQLPPEVIDSLKGANSAPLRELEDAWKQKRESPRIP